MPPIATIPASSLHGPHGSSDAVRSSSAAHILEHWSPQRASRLQLAITMPSAVSSYSITSKRSVSGHVISLRVMVVSLLRAHVATRAGHEDLAVAGRAAARRVGPVASARAVGELLHAPCELRALGRSLHLGRRRCGEDRQPGLPRLVVGADQALP